MARKAVYLRDLLARDEAGLIRITGEEHHHLFVARAEPGEILEVFDGSGAVWTVSLENTGRKDSVARIREKRNVEREPYDLILAMALIRIPAFELAVEKAVEIGVTRITPFFAARSNVNVRRADRWRKIVVEAAKQSKRFHVPVIEDPLSFEEVLKIPAVTKIVFAESGRASLESAVAGAPALYLVGPEGGWTEEEFSTAASHGFQSITLGSGILRAETAAIVGGALIRYELGKMGVANK